MTVYRYIGSFIALALLTPAALFAQVTTTPETRTDSTDTQAWFSVESISGDIDIGDFVVGPGRSEIELEPGESTIIELSVTNRISDNREFRLQVEDITGTPDGSSALVVIEGERGPYSIRDYVTFAEETFVLDLGQRATIPVQVNIPADAEPGGYYGSVLVSTVQLGQTGDAPRNPIIARVGSHVFLTVAGEQNVTGKTTAIQTIPRTNWYTSGPVDLGIVFENNGSLHLNPYGAVSIKNTLGQEVGFIELEPWFVLPQSIRTREITWDREFLFGRYTAVATVNRGYDDILDEVTVTFYVVPYQLIALLFVSLFALFFIFRLFFRTFEFKRK